MNDRIRLYKDYLTQEGFPVTEEGSGLIGFRYEGGFYAVIAEEADEGFFSLVFPNFWPIENDRERTLAYRAGAAATSRTKVAKVFVRDDGQNVLATIELFVGGPEQFKPVFKRCLSAIGTAVNHFRTEMRRAA